LIGEGPFEAALLDLLLEKMVAVDAFYRELGGIVGYQKKILEFLNGGSDQRQMEISSFYVPDFIDITQETPDVLEAIHLGICSLPEMAEMYPLGGAADRLHLVDETTGQELPAAKLGYAGRTLFEGLIRDLQAREYLYFKLNGTQIEVPVVIMTSEEKNNHLHIQRICNDYAWFGRRKEGFRFFVQPLVPAVDPNGNWCLIGPFAPLLKPGGHGALWKLARDCGIFKWLEHLSIKKALIRQINNPIASLDYGLLAFIGWGIKKRGVFGFASCPRVVQSAEGINVVVEKKDGELTLTNTNILFVDLKAIEQAVARCPFPGLLVNLKQTAYWGRSGEKQQSLMARLESTMQNIADVFAEKKKPESTFVTYNKRNKTISTAKKAYVPGGPIQETPEECFYVYLQATRELLKQHCGFLLPPQRSLSDYLQKGPDLVFIYHPALGPLYSLLAQKIFRGKISIGAELQLEIADAEILNIHLQGSLLIHASQPLGHFDEEGILHYSNRTGRCILKNVRVKNRGVIWEESQPYWKNHFTRKEALQIHLNGFSEFVAEDVLFEGHFCFDVPEGIRMRVENKNGKIVVVEEKLEETPFWVYRWEERQGILAARCI
jgi:hypothetical protein